MIAAAKVETENLALSPPLESSDRTSLSCLVIVARHCGLHLSVPQLIHDNVLTEAANLDCAASEMRAVGRPEGQSRSSDLGWTEPSEKGASRNRHAQERRQHGAAAT